MRRKTHETVGVVSLLVLIALFVVAGTLYESRPDIVLKRAWGRLSAIVGRPARTGAIVPVVFDAQDHALSCEVAALKMALAARDIHVSEAELLAAVGFDPTPKRPEAGRIIWGDPYEGFVGDVDGRMPQSGYGVYWDPIAKAAHQWRAARAVRGMTPRELAEEVAAGNPAIVWGYLGDGTSYEWQTPTGKAVHAVLNEHTFVAYGFRGNPEQPDGFLLMDPIYGPRYWETQELFDRMEKFGYSAVILY